IRCRGERKKERDTQQTKAQGQLAGFRLCVCGDSHRCPSFPSRSLGFRNDLRWRQLLEPLRGPSIRACFLMGVLRDAQLPWGATMCKFSTKERKTGGELFFDQGPLPASPLWCRVSFETGVKEDKKRATPRQPFVQLPTSAVPDLPSIL